MTHGVPSKSPIPRLDRLLRGGKALLQGATHNTWRLAITRTKNDVNCSRGKPPRRISGRENARTLRGCLLRDFHQEIHQLLALEEGGAYFMPFAGNNLYCETSA